ncbi:L-serine ammonia-lyase, iron-sulfur-dependent subunit beta [Pullulanibacillus sp. KACC 23026]|uniref:L-serine ammonia-lyase, iron-sulfur-dependent subunit beta n=1 Tax=Pullulanibacillus sp. KACC 23026 TaxID=3028315 RepID=UPI0023AF9EB1|nr:L-serine ammonia-lyase, iron-sulfur-dependent subunit beta [Pullulanibacillus sp. KACC 23026]WEG11621.1 L-serine ammonia-lyase, iron-sulfur-dependent subunit beta [Pullulanibacillus sp. KACC 23026]
MKYRSVFDIIGPVMIGPSSSHTAGAARIGRVARNLFGRMPKKVIIHLYGSFAKTYRGHGTDVALVGGLLDYDTYDERIVNALSDAEKQGMSIDIVEETIEADHPNTARLILEDDEDRLEIVGISIGGGKIEIIELNGYDLRLSGNQPAIFIAHQDRFGAIAEVASILAKHEINISYMEVSRKVKGKTALMVIETDQTVSQKVVDEVSKAPHMLYVATLD